jgi:hypothetical protein
MQTFLHPNTLSADLPVVESQETFDAFIFRVKNAESEFVTVS